MTGVDGMQLLVPVMEAPVCRQGCRYHSLKWLTATHQYVYTVTESKEQIMRNQAAKSKEQATYEYNIG